MLLTEKCGDAEAVITMNDVKINIRNQSLLENMQQNIQIIYFSIILVKEKA